MGLELGTGRWSRAMPPPRFVSEFFPGLARLVEESQSPSSSPPSWPALSSSSDSDRLSRLRRPPPRSGAGLRFAVTSICLDGGGGGIVSSSVG